MKIKFLPLQPNCFAFGGFEIQIQNNLKANEKIGLDVSKLDIWDRSRDFEVLHCWGLGLPNYDSIMWGKKANKKVVLSLLLYDYDTLLSKIKFKLSSYIGIQRYLLQMLAKVDAVSVVNEIQAETCNSLYRVPEHKIHIIPNVVDSGYFNARMESIPANSEFMDYLIVVGNVCSRKNQLMLAEACIKNAVNLLIVGKIMDGEEVYGQRLKKLVDHHANLRWIYGLTENSNELINYYKNAIGLVLPSSVEQQPLSALEAGILGKPVLLGNCTYAKQEIFRNACLVNPASLGSVSDGIKQLVRDPGNYLLDETKLMDCHETNTAAAYKKLYEGL
ncbi:glycosyltransferase family 4 protein [Pedobacter metabolipauper]|uniref:Glycosyltransferase involved in cell wall biosynthesis n=1 Tax=Pedobacter metabolipauper TaxID=425513 RepID=A0A4R6SZI8_9SPHI|nr:glycosyltransferase family 4 protein [Pedobacter metabolipauper]TDQ09965.1 glycosyltransferase involved in cell wall biosynthesis [Pedobacter metabolipauper]